MKDNNVIKMCGFSNDWNKSADQQIIGLVLVTLFTFFCSKTQIRSFPIIANHKITPMFCASGDLVVISFCEHG
jgi:hypothetical protein